MLLTATPDPTNWPPRIALHVTGSTGTTVSVTRQNTDGTTYSVRSGSPATIVSGGARPYDYESPWRLGGTYTARDSTGATATATVAGLWEFGAVNPWLIHPGIPSLSMPIEVVRLGDRTTSVSRGVFKVLGRADPVTVGDGTRGSEQFDLVVRTRWNDDLGPSDLQDEDRMRRILADGSPLLMQFAYDGSRRWRWQWVSVDQVTASDVVPWVDSEGIEWTLPCTVVRAPSGSLQAQWTNAGVLARYATNTDVLATFATCDDLLIDNPAA